MEAKIRWKDNRNIPHLDLCRPFAAHCIGYPVVTLGFGFKSYIGYRIRQRKQKEVAKENEFYMQLLQQALPQEEVTEKSDETAEITEPAAATAANTTTSSNCKNTHHNSNSKVNGSIDGSLSSHMNGSVNNSKHHNVRKSNESNSSKENGCIQQHIDNNHHSHNNNNNNSNHHHQDIIPNNAILSKNNSKAANHLNFNNLQSVKNTNTTASYQQIQNGITKELNVPAKCSPYKNNKDDHNTYIASSNKKEYEKEKIIKDTNYDETITASSNSEPTSQKRKDRQQKEQYQSNASNNNHNSNCNNQLNNEKNKVCEHCQRHEGESKRLKSELQTIKSLEQEVRQKYENVKSCLQTKQKEQEDLQKQ